MINPSFASSSPTPPPINPFEQVTKKVTNVVADQMSAHAVDAMNQGMAPKDVFVMLGQLLGTGESRMGAMPPAQPQDIGIPTPQTPPPQQGQQVLESLLQTSPAVGNHVSGGVPPTPPPGNQRQSPEQSVQLLQALLSHPQVNQAVQDVAGVGQEQQNSSLSSQTTRPQQVSDGEFQNPTLKPYKNLFELLFNQTRYDPATNTVTKGGIFNQQEPVSISALQKNQGKEPIQPKDRLTVESQRAEARSKAGDEYMKALTSPMTPESMKSMSQLEKMSTALDDMASLLDIRVGENGKAMMGNTELLGQKQWAVWASQNKQRLIRARDTYINQLLRRDSGATIGEKELSEAKRVFGFDLGWGSMATDPNVVANMLVEARKQVSKDIGRISPNETQKKRYQYLREKGYTNQEIKDYFGQIGEY